MIANEERLWEKVLDNAIDESLWTNPNRDLGISMQSIVNARKFIQGEEFRLLYKVLHAGDSSNLVKMLRMMWVELARSLEKSAAFRGFFNPDVSGLKKLGELSLRHPEEWCHVRNPRYMERWNNEA